MNTSEMIKVVEDYIFQKKGVKVIINEPDNLDRLMLLSQAYTVAISNKN